jgi:hypothetical protein
VRILKKMSTMLRKCLLSYSDSPPSFPPVVRAVLNDATQMGILAHNSDLLDVRLPDHKNALLRCGTKVLDLHLLGVLSLESQEHFRLACLKVR